MKRKTTFLAALAVAASLVLTGCAGVTERSYDVLGDGAQKALDVTLRVSAGVVNWMAEPQNEDAPSCPRTLPAA
ncbi:MAG TPA: hypothetical protein VF789_13355 [Thermoanaerobaculia bacterium]